MVFMIEARSCLLSGCAGYMCSYKWRTSEVPEADTDPFWLALFVMYMGIILFGWMNLVWIETGYHRCCRGIGRTNTRFVTHVSSLSLWSLHEIKMYISNLIRSYKPENDWSNTPFSSIDSRFKIFKLIIEAQMKRYF